MTKITKEEKENIRLIQQKMNEMKENKKIVVNCCRCSQPFVTSSNKTKYCTKFCCTAAHREKVHKKWEDREPISEEKIKKKSKTARENISLSAIYI